MAKIPCPVFLLFNGSMEEARAGVRACPSEKLWHSEPKRGLAEADTVAAKSIPGAKLLLLRSTWSEGF